MLLSYLLQCMSSTPRDTNVYSKPENFFTYPKYLYDLTEDISGSAQTKHAFPIDQKNLPTEKYSVTFCPEPERYCVGMVDMVDSTRISAILGSEKMSRYYQIFINSMSRILNEFGGQVVKNIGDCLLFYFPTLESKSQCEYLIECLECSFALVDSHDFICEYLKREDLPCLNYRVSMDYGNIILMKSSNSNSIDMIGTPINMCSKINRSAPTNGIVVGGDIREMIKKISQYQFTEIEGYSVGLKSIYATYVVNRNQ